VNTLTKESFVADLADGDWHGMIKMYDPHLNYGIITVEGRDADIHFAKPLERDPGQTLFQRGDQVAFEAKHGWVVKVRLIAPIDPQYNQFWCERCDRCRTYAEVQEEYRDGLWGEGRVWVCRTCGEAVRPGTCPKSETT
jgi:cold shock CspA family protein